MSLFGKNLKYVRKYFSITQAQLSSQLIKKQSTIGNWENGVSEPDATDLLQLSQYFGIPIDQFVKSDIEKGKLLTPAIKRKFRTKQDLKPPAPPAMYAATKPGSLVQEPAAGYGLVLQELRKMNSNIEKLALSITEMQKNADKKKPK